LHILIVNWTNWLGYHFINELLEADYTVHALITDPEERTNRFAQFFTRNSSFSFVDKDNLLTYSDTVVIGNFPIKSVSSKRTWHINCTFRENNGQCVFVFTPILYGEWMSLNEEGIFFQDNFISFASKKFHNETIYIKDFLKIFQQWLKSTLIPHKIVLCVNRKLFNREIFMLENIVYFRDNRPKYKHIETVKKHYKKYKRLYEID